MYSYFNEYGKGMECLIVCTKGHANKLTGISQTKACNQSYILRTIGFKNIRKFQDITVFYVIACIQLWIIYYITDLWSNLLSLWLILTMLNIQWLYYNHELQIEFMTDPLMLGWKMNSYYLTCMFSYAVKNSSCVTTVPWSRNTPNFWDSLEFNQF